MKQINVNPDIIDLSHNGYWDREDFLEEMERVRKLIIELLANVREDYEPRPREIGYCLTVFEIIKDMEIIDGRQKEQKEDSK